MLATHTYNGQKCNPNIDENMSLSILNQKFIPLNTYIPSKFVILNLLIFCGKDFVSSVAICGAENLVEEVAMSFLSYIQFSFPISC